jgi:hypothetical protein
MPESTTIRVAPSTRDAVRELADHDHITLDEQIQRLVRAERQRRIGASLAVPLSTDDEHWVEASADTVGTHASG